MRKAVVLLSGGLDSAVALAVARERGHAPTCLFVDYGQANTAERFAARELSAGLPLFEIMVPLLRLCGAPAMPVGYVPARNSVLLSVALSTAEAVGAGTIWFGANRDDAANYPDCRPEFLRAWEAMASCATQCAPVRVEAPLLASSKVEIVLEAVRLGVPIERTTSCYEPPNGMKECGRCGACERRHAALAEAGWCKSS